MAKRVIIRVPESANVAKLTDEKVMELIGHATKDSGIAKQLVIQQGDHDSTEFGPQSWSQWTRSC